MIADYHVLDELNREHGVLVVKNIHDHNLYVMKTLSVYNEDVYRFLYDHPTKGIPRIKEICSKDDRLVIIEEYISGSDLQTLLDSGRTFSTDETAHIAIEICSILQDLHSKGSVIVHRDIKPSNVILKEDGSVYLLDFNAAKYEDGTKYKDTTLIGTVGYAAPEQYGFGSSTTQTDIYSIGILMKTLSQDKSDKLHSVIKKCTEIDPKNRYGSLSDLQNALHDAISFTRHDLTPVGFRTRNTNNMIVASFGYLAILYLSISLEVRDAANGIDLWLNRSFFFLICMFYICLIFNYMDIQQKFGIKKDWAPWKKIVAVALIGITVLAIEMVILTTIEYFCFR